MSDTKASDEPVADALAAVDFWPGVQGGVDVQIPVSHVMAAVLLLLGDTDGTLAADSDTKLATQKAIRTYVAAAGGGGAFTYASSAPGSPAVGDRWVDSTLGILYTWISDGVTSQWVEF